MAWLGQPVLIDELLFKTKHGIVDQSLHARMGAEPTNGDGFGLGWYGSGDGPGVYHSVAPAWGDANLRELAAHIESPLFLCHVRAAIGSPVQQTNCHPFRHGRWLFVHNGYLGGFREIRRELMLAIDPELFANVVGSTDTEVVFQLALTLGLEADPITALERTVGAIEAAAARHGIPDAVQASFGVSDGESLWAVRYATSGPARSLFASDDAESIRRLHPENPRFQRLSDGDRLIVSEPFSDLPGVWREIPGSTAVTVRGGGVFEERAFSAYA
jgi:glutamine amidotransferase